MSCKAPPNYSMIIQVEAALVTPPNVLGCVIYGTKQQPPLQRGSWLFQDGCSLLLEVLWESLAVLEQPGPLFVVRY